MTMFAFNFDLIKILSKLNVKCCAQRLLFMLRMPNVGANMRPGDDEDN